MENTAQSNPKPKVSDEYVLIRQFDGAVLIIEKEKAIIFFSEK